jgi:hypothetical protein
MDEFGDLYLYGEVKNVATKMINAVTIYYTVYDANGAYVGDSYTTVYLATGKKK